MGCYSTPLAGPIAQLAPGSWEVIVAADRVLRHDREPINGCRKAAVKAEKAVHCTIQ